MKKITLFTSILIIACNCNAQEENKVIDFKYKLGLKYISEHSAFRVLSDTAAYLVHNVGVPMIFGFNKKKSSIETGVYLINKKERYVVYDFSSMLPSNGNEDLITFKYIRVPLNYRLDTKSFYLSLGIYFDNLISMSSKTEHPDLKDNFPDRKFKSGANIMIGIEKSFFDDNIAPSLRSLDFGGLSTSTSRKNIWLLAINFLRV